MRKPEYRWKTKLHTAYLGPRNGVNTAATIDVNRQESFELHFESGDVGALTCGLQEQVVDEKGAQDPDLDHAVRCWLIARGMRKINLKTCTGKVLARGDILPNKLRLSSDRVGKNGGLKRISAEPQKLITLCPSNIEVVAALGALANVVACEDSSDWPEQVALLPRLGPDLAPDLDQVEKYEPDLILASLTVPGMERVVVGLHARELNYLVLAPRCLDDVLDELAIVGRCLGLELQASKVCEEMRNAIASLQLRAQERRNSRPASLADPGVYLEWWPRPMFSPGKACYSNELIELAGGRNVFRHREGASLELSTEELVAANPDLAFLSWCGVRAEKLEIDRLRNRPGLQRLEAVINNRIYPLDEQFAGRPGPRMLEAAWIMERAIAEFEAQRI